jgi:glutamate carboxypeptidase
MVAAVEGAYGAHGALTERVAGSDGHGDHLLARTPYGQDAPGILVLSHLDTVHPKGTLAGDLPFRIEGDSAFGPGIYDMKGGAYIAFHAVGRLLEAGVATPLGITHLFLSDEEVGSPTSRPVIEAEARRAKYVLVTEPAREGGKVVTARKGVARYDVVATGRPAHAGSRHQDGRNAIAELARQVLALEAMTDYGRGITVNVGVIEGGTGVNVVPARCSLRVETRLPSLAVAEEVMARIEGLTPANPDIRLEITGALNRPPYEKTAAIEALLGRAQVLARGIGFELEDLATGGCSDGNFTAPIAPTLDGLGVDGKGGHTDYEQLYISSLVPREALLHGLFRTLS